MTASVSGGFASGSISLHLTESTHDLEKGLLSSASALGKIVSGAEEGDEIEFEQDDGRRRKVLIETIYEASVPTAATRFEEAARLAQEKR